jgi:rod shape-determining protein MreC
MRGLLQLFARFGGGLLFFLLEVASLILVVQYNQNQNDIFVNSWGLFMARFEQRVDKIGDYYQLRGEVIELQRKNINLMQQLENAKYNNQLLRDTISQDSLKQMYTFVEANVISNSVANVNNYIRLNKGSNHNIEKHMGVIADQGVVGVIREVSPGFSSVMSILHSQSRIKAAVKSKGYFGTLTWDGIDSKVMDLEAIPKHANIEVGDTVVTSGYSQIFPEGITIGTVRAFNLDPGENFFNIDVELNIDMGNLRYVYIVENLFKEEHEALDQAINE